MTWNQIPNRLTQDKSINQSLTRSKFSAVDEEALTLSSPSARRFDPNNFSLQDLSEEDQLQRALEQSMNHSHNKIPELFNLDGNSDFELGLEDVFVEESSELSGCELDPDFIRTKRKGKFQSLQGDFFIITAF